MPPKNKDKSKGKGQVDPSQEKLKFHAYFTRKRSQSVDTMLTDETKTSAQSKGQELERKQTSQKSDLTNTDIADLIGRLEKTLTTKLEHVEQSLNTKLKEVEDECKRACAASLEPVIAENDRLKAMLHEQKCSSERRITELEGAVEFLSAKFDELHRDSDKTITSRVEKIEADNRYQEQRSRKYNLLLFGIPERITRGVENEEDTLKKVRDFFQNDLRIQKEKADEIIIANAHRLPYRQRRKRDDKLSEAEKRGYVQPDPIIVKLVKMSDKHLILGHAKNLKLIKDMNYYIRTDLPAHLKSKRAVLAKIAFKMRKPGGVRSFIKETNSDVILLFKRDTEERWNRFNYKPDMQYDDDASEAQEDTEPEKDK